MIQARSSGPAEALRREIAAVQTLIEARLAELFEEKFAAGDYRIEYPRAGETVDTLNHDGHGPPPAVQTRASTLPSGVLEVKTIQVQAELHPDLVDLYVRKDDLLSRLDELGSDGGK